jgi:hypothetical protein
MTFRIIRTFTLPAPKPDAGPVGAADRRGQEGAAAQTAARVFRLHGPAARLDMPSGLPRPDARAAASLRPKAGLKVRLKLRRRSLRVVRLR